jgi:AraC family transcriptional regulator of adaptative response/methylated-DNA-[protein]-cysteine methyltransferase
MKLPLNDPFALPIIPTLAEDDSPYQAVLDSLDSADDAVQKPFKLAPGKPVGGESLVFTRLETPLGSMIAMAEQRGLVMLEFLDRPILMRELRELRGRYGYVLTPGAHPHLAQIEDELTRYFEGSLTRFDVPLHTPGSVFQNQVWDALRQVPYGTTCTYGEIAVLLGKPGASRAVGLANGSNRMSIVLPCHRVIGADGSLTGYGGGKSRKEYLLRLERAALQISEQGRLDFEHPQE